MKKNCIGILGGGQLCQMLAEYLTEAGKNVYFIDPSSDPPAKHTKAIHIQKNYDDFKALDILISECDVITYEFENIPMESLDYLDKKIDIFPSKYILSISQNRLNEKSNFMKCGIKTPSFFKFDKDTNFERELEKTNIKLPVIIKTNTLGYDGKGQYHINSKDEIIKKINLLDKNIEYIVEEKIDFIKEFSVIIGRNHNKEIYCFEPIENIHKNGILDISISPSRISESIKNKSINLATKFVEKNNLIGILTIEMFLDKKNNILFNEIAPRPHNSGHLTRESHSISQFEMLGKILVEDKIQKPRVEKNAIMKNILGDFFINKNYKNVISEISDAPDHFVKMYHKEEAKIGRKMGHVTIFTNDIENTIVKINKLID